MKKSKKKGFTIVELVIVISVIAIISSILIPTFSGVVSESKDAAAVADAKAAYEQYIAEAVMNGEEAEMNFIYKYSEGIFILIKNGQVDAANIYASESDALAAVNSDAVMRYGVAATESGDKLIPLTTPIPLTTAAPQTTAVNT